MTVLLVTFKHTSGGKGEGEDREDGRTWIRVCAK